MSDNYFSTLISIISIVIAVASAIAILISYLAYKNKIKRALENEHKSTYNSDDYKARSQAHSSLPSPGTTLSVCCIILLIYLCIAVGRLSGLYVNINELMNQNLYLQGSISHLENNLIDELEKQNSIVSSFDIVPKSPDIENLTCDLEFTVSFKEIAPNANVFIVFSDNSSIELNKVVAGTYNGTAKMPMFNNNISNEFTVAINDEFSEKTLQLTSDDKYISFGYLWQYCLPNMFASVLEDKDDKNFELIVDAIKPVVELNFYDQIKNNIKSAELVFYNAGKEYSKVDITDEMKKYPNCDFTPKNICIPNKELGNKFSVELITTMNNGLLIENNLYAVNTITNEPLNSEITYTFYDSTGKIIYEE